MQEILSRQFHQRKRNAEEGRCQQLRPCMYCMRYETSDVLVKQSADGRDAGKGCHGMGRAGRYSSSRRHCIGCDPLRPGSTGATSNFESRRISGVEFKCSNRDMATYARECVGCSLAGSLAV
jgi:hypothetical protein